MSGKIDPEFIKTVRVNQLAATYDDIDAETIRAHLIAKSVQPTEPPVHPGIARLLRHDLFRALLFLTLINGVVFVYYHICSSDDTISQAMAREVLENFYPDTAPEVSVIVDIANLHGLFRDSHSVQLDAIRRKLFPFVTPEQELIVDGHTPPLQFQEKNGGTLWLGKP